jgi:hypothetical protein
MMGGANKWRNTHKDGDEVEVLVQEHSDMVVKLVLTSDEHLDVSHKLQWHVCPVGGQKGTLRLDISRLSMGKLGMETA